MADSPQLAIATTESERIEEWRILQFASMGFSAAEVITLMEFNIDYHDAALLLRGGCSHSTVIRILS
jgi:hypothetical protein